MNQDYIKPDNWSIIEEGFDRESIKSSESLFSIGNAMGQRANFEETIVALLFKEVISLVFTIPIKQK
jgi:maltose phosphorylase